MAPSICGGLITSRHDVLRLGWTVTALVTLATFLASIIFTARNRSYYAGYVAMYETDDDYNDYYNNYNNGENDDGSQQSGGSQDNNDDGNDVYSYYSSLAELKSGGMRFAGLYTSCWAAALVGYGGWVITGAQVPGTTSALHLGIYMGALVMFANWGLVCAVTLGEFWVYDNRERRDREEMDVKQYALERSSTAFSTLCIVLSVAYLMFAALLFLNQDVLVGSSSAMGMGKGKRGSETSSRYSPPSSVGVGGKSVSAQEGFITRSSSGYD